MADDVAPTEREKAHNSMETGARRAVARRRERRETPARPIGGGGARCSGSGEAGQGRARLGRAREGDRVNQGDGVVVGG